MKQLLASLTHLGNGLGLLHSLDRVMASDQGTRAFVLAGPVLGLAPDDTGRLRRPVRGA